MKRLTFAFLSIVIVIGLMLSGCSTTGDDSDKKTPNQSTESTKSSSVSPEHEKLLQEAMELAKQGKTVQNQEKYKDITDAEVHQVFGEAADGESADGNVAEYYIAGKYEMTILYPCGKCLDDGNPLKIGSIEVGKPTMTTSKS